MKMALNQYEALMSEAADKMAELQNRVSQDAETIKALEAQIATKNAALKAAKVVIEMMERPDGMGDVVNAALDARCAKIDAALAGSAS